MASRPRKRARRSRASDGAPNSGASSALSPPLPLPSKEAPILDTYMANFILEFLDGDSFVTATAVSKAFRDALIPRQRNVSMNGFPSYESMKQMGFTGAVFFSGRDSNLVTNDVLADLATSFPRLASVDLSGCEIINLKGIKRLVERLGPRLERFTMIRSRLHEKKSDQRVTPAIIKVVSTAPNLSSLKLVLATKCSGETLQPLNNKTSLRNLLFMFAGSKPISLPRNLPNLRHLSVWTDFTCGFKWTELEHVHYPNLRSLVITDCQLADSSCPKHKRLSADVLISIMSKAPNMKSLTIRLISPFSKLHFQKTEQINLLTTFMTSRGIRYTGPSMSNWRYY